MICSPARWRASPTDLEGGQTVGVHLRTADEGAFSIPGCAAASVALRRRLDGAEPLVAAAREAGLCTNLITSGIGLTERRLKALDEAGLDHVQLSPQGTDAAMADDHEDHPKSCMGGWGSTGRNIAPDGTVLPRHAAQTIPHPRFDSIRDRPLGEIWYDSAAVNAYRGDDC